MFKSMKYVLAGFVSLSMVSDSFALGSGGDAPAFCGARNPSGDPRPSRRTLHRICPEFVDHGSVLCDGDGWDRHWSARGMAAMAGGMDWERYHGTHRDRI